MIPVTVLRFVDGDVASRKHFMNLTAVAYVQANCAVCKVEEAVIPDNLNRRKMANISVIQKRTVLHRPIKPKKALHMAVGIISGVVSGPELEFLSRSVLTLYPLRTERDSGLTVLCPVPIREEE
jgi:capsular polysaccharide biosynthesis protein